jgi:amylosucrase
MAVINVGSDQVFAFVRTHEQQRIVVLANFTERVQPIAANEIRLYGLGYSFTDLITDQPLHLTDQPIHLEPYQVVWLASA